ncbi:MAG TPA: DASH family cryptochrome [Saprospiraceae bacterium]|nr:DASH family cryptochrome [Saprospiraceae bacterium]
MKSGIVWFRNDLRLHDNEALTEAMESLDYIVPVYIFDERLFNRFTHFGFRKTGVFRAKFMIDSVLDLKNNLIKTGSDLIIRVGKPEVIIPEIVNSTKASWVFCNRERTDEEVKVQDRLEKNLWEIGREIRFSRGKMLYYTADLPFPVTHTPDIFSNFRKEVEHIVQVRKPLPVPFRLQGIPFKIESEELPDLNKLGYSDVEIKKAKHMAWKGGETAGLERLNYYLWEGKWIQYYKMTRNGLLGNDYSSKFSPYLAQGCLSPKMIYHEIQLFEKEIIANDSTYWLKYELMWRDFFRLMGKKHGNNIFRPGGTKGISGKWAEDREKFQLWAQGKTGIPFVDANMRELNHTGYMSNRGRQNVASFLIHDLEINWLMGAEYLESLLIDYDPCSNYGNWNYIAGVGSDPRENRRFNVVQQGKRYDPSGEFIRYWIPELSDVPNEYIHEPQEMPLEIQLSSRCRIGEIYPYPVSTGEGTF